MVSENVLSELKNDLNEMLIKVKLSKEEDVTWFHGAIHNYI